ncbi:hypothetical protein FGG08_005252 [Glutinoglossum americanum]|uniref:Uncharacterized protein n=1 Tax=Glutinoglossum americanum TaxID=1670608 RepID=A0A9P8I0P4_9PEZI|nr:hypothetical protein FGG08_005252 [Glutinoglossum americanum]
MEEIKKTLSGKQLRTVFSLDSPFSSVQCILSPIGQHRSSHVDPSKGKRIRKRKRNEGQSGGGTSNIQPSISSVSQQAGVNPSPPQPEVSSYLTIGLNSTTRSLELQAQQSIPESLSPQCDLLHDMGNISTKSKPCGASPEGQLGALCELIRKPLVAVFVSRSSQPALLHAHLPLLTVTASLSHPRKPPIALVTLPKGSEARLASALGMPRVGVVGLSEGAPGSTALVEYVRESVKSVAADWLDGGNRWRGTEIKVLKATIGGGKGDKDAKVMKAAKRRSTRMSLDNRK